MTITAGNTIWSGSDFLAIGDHVSNGYTNVIAKSFSQQSTLSSKTNIEEVDPKDALDLVNQTDIRSYQYKSDVEQGKTKRYTSLIIDDVNDVSQYHAPDAFVNEERTGRDDGSAVGYLFLAVKELTRRIKNLEEKLNG
ncbi:tail fiber domain-containing protein [Limosilactobacillus fermentum]